MFFLAVGMSPGPGAIQRSQAKDLRRDGKYGGEPAQQGDVGERLYPAFIAGDLRGRVAAALA